MQYREYQGISSYEVSEVATHKIKMIQWLIYGLQNGYRGSKHILAINFNQLGGASNMAKTHSLSQISTCACDLKSSVSANPVL